ncbi:pyridoxamine 5'-phosphate oxidase [Halovulum dunhuangense]|uniref:Pyridoxine/pyridoxamine 5'-phosphate oxidase n=1 Tax=Halovulum dunhuangense TaxID=1505036 RepID=A0A849L2P1_9RHOB|nr:pyridoxamine 5'-phosphate oxidase [Halovulum dunhuangense]NNU80492.1 pyridoxamine 5'-phosphate oxidase [Halovulum dunhuangense]
MDRHGIFAGDNPFDIARRWLDEAWDAEINDANAIALSTVDAHGMPNVRMVLVKEIEQDAFVFYTNYGSVKAGELDGAGKAAFLFHWKSLRRQIRVRGTVTREDGPQADAYYNSRGLGSRLGAWASQQSSVIANRAELEARLRAVQAEHGENPPRPPFWGGFRVKPVSFEFWADGEHRLHDRFRWLSDGQGGWTIDRLSP